MFSTLSPFRRNFAVEMRFDRENRRRLSNSSELDCVRLALSLLQKIKTIVLTF